MAEIKQKLPMKKSRKSIDLESLDEDYPDPDELEYQDKLEVSKKRTARLVKRENSSVTKLNKSIITKRAGKK